MEVKFCVWPRSHGYDQDTFDMLFTLCTINGTVHSGPHNTRRELHPLYTMHIVIKCKIGVLWSKSNHLAISSTIIDIL